MHATFSDYLMFFLIVFCVIFLVHKSVNTQPTTNNQQQYIHREFSNRPNENNQNNNDNEPNDYNNYNHTYYYNSNDN